MNKQALLNQLYIIRAAADSAIFMLQEEVPDVEVSEECQHPEDKREDCSTMGHKRWLCKLCGHVEEVS